MIYKPENYAGKNTDTLPVHNINNPPPANHGRQPAQHHLTRNSPYCEKAVLIDTSARKETAWGGCINGNGNAWWNYLEVDEKFDRRTGLSVTVGSTETIWAGRYTDVGTISYDPQTGIIKLALTSGWALQDTPQPVKIQGYDLIPASRPSADLFSTYQGTETIIKVGRFKYYAVQLDVQLHA